MNMNSISNINCKPQQPAKALGFGCAGGDLDGGGGFSYFGPKSVESKPVSVESKPISFENQVLANQQKMIGQLNDIKFEVRYKIQ